MRKLFACVLCITMMFALSFIMSACGDEKPEYERGKSSNSSTDSVASNSEHVSTTSDASNTQSTVTSSKTESVVTKTDEQKIVGTWRGKIALENDALEEMIGDIEENPEEAELFLKYFDMDKIFDVNITIVFKENGTCALSIADEDIDNYVDDIIEVMCDGTIDMLKDMVKGTGMSWQGYLAQNNMTEKQLRESLIAEAEMDRQGLVDSIKESTQAKTKYYKLSNGKMYTSENKKFEGDDVDIEDYELSETTLKIIDKEKGIITLNKVK